MASFTTLLVNTELGFQKLTGDEGPFLLASVVGSEGVSLPFSYILSVYRDPAAGQVDPKILLDKTATFGMLGKGLVSHADDRYIFRHGTIDRFEKTGMTNLPLGDQHDFLTYTMRLVPAFKMLDRESAYRTFENTNVLDIIKEIMDDFPNLPKNYLDLRLLNGEFFPKIDYCAQFGETSFAFLSRLMRQYGIWYFFDHFQAPSLEHETMVLGRSHVPPEPCKLGELKTDEMRVVFQSPGVTEIIGFSRSYEPGSKHVELGDFNPLAPTTPIFGFGDVVQQYDLLPSGKEVINRFRQEFFPNKLRTNSEKDTVKFAADSGEDSMHFGELGTFISGGQTINKTFQSGRAFTIIEDKTGSGAADAFPATPGKKPTYIITKLDFAATEQTYGHTTFNDIVNFFESVLIKPPVDLFKSLFAGQGSTMGQVLNDGLNNYFKSALENQTFTAMSGGGVGKFLGFGNKGSDPSGVTNYVFAGMLADVSNLTKVLFNSISTFFERHGDSYNNSFTAVPCDGETYARMPLPVLTKPQAAGPHLAVVVGPKGTEIDFEVGEIYADALGRVRVRFPWQRFVPADPAGTSPTASVTDPFKTDRRTCWAPVSEGWAGRSFGTQFLPRIGQQVVVDFIDGDPDRPIITGRVYSADTGPTNLPFVTQQVAQKHMHFRDLFPPITNVMTPHSGIKTFSTLAPRDVTGNLVEQPRFHLLRFDDTYGKEQYLIRSQHWLDITAFSNRYETIYGNRNMTVGGTLKDPPKPPVKVAGDYIAKVHGNYHLKVVEGGYFPPGVTNSTGNRYSLVEHNDEIKVGGDSNQAIGGNWSTSTGGQATIDASSVGGKIVLNASMEITLSVGNSAIVIGPAGISIFSPAGVSIGATIIGPIPTGTPPVPDVGSPPIDPSVKKPNDPVPADPGDNLDSPKDR
jgi:uncharacterized protein involved in type VI secretion and phage assembly